MLKACYINVNGLPIPKFNSLIQLLQSNRIDLLILAETWFCDLTHYKTSEYYIHHSPLPTVTKSQGHENGGILILAQPPLRNHINIEQSGEFHTQLSIKKIPLTTVYFPPRLDSTTIANTLNHLQPTDILVGDFNFRLGKQNNDTTSYKTDRYHQINEYSTTRSLQLQKFPSTCPSSKTDHIYSKTRLEINYQSNPRTLTDHGSLYFAIPINPPQSTQDPHWTQDPSLETGDPRRQSIKYSLKDLDSPLICTTIVNTWNKYYGDRLTDIGSQLYMLLTSQLSEQSTSTTQDLIDNVYDTFSDSINMLQSQILSPFYPQSMRHKPASFHHKMKLPALIQRFKATQRARHASNPLKSSDPSLPVAEQGLLHYSNIFQHLPFNPPTPTEFPKDLDLETSSLFNIYRIQRCIMSYSIIKTGGPDNIHTKLLKVLCHSQSFLTALESIYKCTALSGLVPSDWLNSRLYLLKKDKDNPSVTNTRPINLSNILRRMFERILLQSWTNSIAPAQWTKLHPLQAGFRTGYSCMTHLLLSDHLSRTGYPLSTFLDIKAAYDSVPWHRMEERLIKVGCPILTVRLIRNIMMVPSNLILNINRIDVGTITTARGMFQGSILSPLLFGIFIDDLATRCNTITKTLLFADDINIKSKSPQETQVALNLCQDWAIYNHMRWGISKCGSLGTQSPLKLGLDSIPIVSSYKYLGAPHLATRVDWSSLTQSYCTKAKAFMIANSDTLTSLSPAQRLCIWRAFCRPLTEYCLPITSTWCNRQISLKSSHKSTALTILKEYDTFHKLSMEFISGIRKPPNSLLETLTNLGPPHLRLDRLSFGLALHLRSVHSDNPITPLISQFLSSSPHHIVPYLSNHSLYQEFCSMYHPDNHHKPFYQQQFLNITHYSTLTSSSSQLHSYLVRPSFRPYLDYSLSFHSLNGLKWRCNRFGIGFLCPCGSKFNRRHINSCLLLQDHAPSQVLLSSRSFIAESRLLYDQAEDPSSFHYSILDYLINSNDEPAFNAAINHIRSLLLQTTHGTISSTTPPPMVGATAPQTRTIDQHSNAPHVNPFPLGFTGDMG